MRLWFTCIHCNSIICSHFTETASVIIKTFYSLFPGVSSLLYLDLII
nr:MAG TPA: hypothetical protein [Caudoviricetes sp.]